MLKASCEGHREVNAWLAAKGDPDPEAYGVARAAGAGEGPRGVVVAERAGVLVRPGCVDDSANMRLPEPWGAGFTCGNGSSLLIPPPARPSFPERRLQDAIRYPTFADPATRAEWLPLRGRRHAHAPESSGLSDASHAMNAVPPIRGG